MGVVRSLERVHKDLSEPKLPYIFRAELSNHRFLDADENAFIVASGKGFTPDMARLSAMGEAVERYAASNWGESRIIRGTAGSLDIAHLDPACLVLFTDAQYETLKYQPYSSDSSLGWVPMRSLGKGEDIAVPALAVLMAYETQGDEPFLFPITSNGLAAGPTLASAVLNGAYECIERDAFLATWLNCFPAARIDPSDHPDMDIRAMITAYARRGVDLELYHLPTDNGVEVFMAIGVNTGDMDGPAAVVGLGADHDPVNAARSALIEVCQVRPSLRMRMRTKDTNTRMAELVAEPMLVTELEDHDLLYADQSMLYAFDFLRSQPAREIDWNGRPQTDPADTLEILTARLKRNGTDLLYANLTTDDVTPLGAHVARVVIPNYQPMHFGVKERRLAATRLYQLPEILDIGRPTTAETLNPLPHPLA